MYAAKLPAAKNSSFYNIVPFFDTPRSHIPEKVELRGRESGQIKGINRRRNVRGETSCGEKFKFLQQRPIL